MSEPGIGHNGGDPLNQGAQQQLRSMLERIERVNSEADEIKEQLKELYSEVKGTGFDTKIVRKLVAMRKKDRAKLQEERAILELYASAMGMLDLV